MDNKNRVKAFAKRLKDNHIDAAIIINQNVIRYFTGFVMNQFAESILIIEQDATISYLVPKLDFYRAIRDCWIDDIHAYAEDTPDHLSPLRNIINKEWRTVGIETETITVKHMSYIKEVFKGNFQSVDPIIEQQLKVKTNQEIQLIKKAADIASYTMNEVMNYIRENKRVTELEVAGFAKYVMEKQGAENYSFQPFIMSGVDSALPRRVPSTKELVEGELIVFDMGCIYEGYCSDITRTFALGTVNEKQKEIYDISYEAQKRAIQAIRPGKTAEEIDAVARDYIIEQGYGDYFPHLTGHGIGVSVHEYPIIDQGEQAVLEENMIVTIEPGIYLPDVGAVRIEDMILITTDGYEYLTNSPRDLILK